MTALTDALREASAAEIADALLALEDDRPSHAYNVGIALVEKGASKEFPGPACGWEPKEMTGVDVIVTGLDPKVVLAHRQLLESLFGVRLDAPLETQPPFRVQANVSKKEALSAKAALEASGFIVDLDPVYAEPATHRRTLKDLLGSGPRA